MNRNLWEKAVAFHGHECPGLAIGFKACEAAMKTVSAGFSDNEEIVCVTENDACGVDAVQALLSCTFGKGNLIYRGTGKQAFSFFNRSNGKKLRVCLIPGKNTNMDRLQWKEYILNSPPEEIFSYSEPGVEVPERARLFRTLICELCGEGAPEHKMHLQDGKKSMRRLFFPPMTGAGNAMKKRAPLLLLIALTLGFFISCDGGKRAENTGPGTRLITDYLGREVEIPNVVGRIVPLGNTPRMITYLGLSEKVVGIGGMDPERISPVTAYAYANRNLWASVPLVGTDAFGSTNYYPEQIISAGPEVIFCSCNKELADDIQTKTGIPVIAVPIGTLFGKDYEQALRLLGEVCNVRDRAEAVITYINDFPERSLRANC